MKHTQLFLTICTILTAWNPQHQQQQYGVVMGTTIPTDEETLNDQADPQENTPEMLQEEVGGGGEEEEDPPPLPEDAVAVGFFIAFETFDCGTFCNVAQQKKKLKLYRKVGRAGGFKWVNIKSYWLRMSLVEDSITVAEAECESPVITEVNKISCEAAPDDNEEFDEGIDDDDRRRRDLLAASTIQVVPPISREHHRILLSCHTCTCYAMFGIWATWGQNECYCEGCGGARRQRQLRQRQLQRNLRELSTSGLSKQQIAALPKADREELMRVEAIVACESTNIPCVDCSTAFVGLVYDDEDL